MTLRIINGGTYMLKLQEEFIKTKFELEDGYSVNCYVIGMTSKKFDDITIQISKVVPISDFSKAVPAEDGLLIPYRYIYEEIDKNDFVIYCRFMGIDHIKKNYKWASTLWG